MNVLKINYTLFIVILQNNHINLNFSAFDILQTDTIESLILAYDKSESSEDKLTGIKCLWTVIEEYVNAGKLFSVGVSDVATDMFINLFNWAKVKKKLHLKIYNLKNSIL